MSTTGFSSTGINANAHTDLAIDSGSVSTENDSSDGIFAIASDGYATITSESVTTLGDHSSGIDVSAYGAVQVTSHSVDTTGKYSRGISAYSSSGDVTVPSFTWGTATNQKAGWFFDFDASLAERQVSDICTVPGKLLFGSIYPTKGSCGEGGGRLYILDALAGSGISEESQVGVLAAPLVINLGSTSLSVSNTAGRRRASEATITIF